jgi:hypothetical protein
MWHSVCTYRRQVVLIFPGWLMRSGLFRDGVKWGFAGRGSLASPFRFLGASTVTLLVPHHAAVIALTLSPEPLNMIVMRAKPHG